MAAAERLRMACERMPLSFEGKEARVTVSVGACVYDPLRPVELSSLMKQAENALHKSKENGRNRVTVSMPINA